MTEFARVKLWTPDGKVYEGTAHSWEVSHSLHSMMALPAWEIRAEGFDDLTVSREGDPSPVSCDIVGLDA